MSLSHISDVVLSTGLFVMIALNIQIYRLQIKENKNIKQRNSELREENDTLKWLLKDYDNRSN